MKGSNKYGTTGYVSIIVYDSLANLGSVKVGGD